MKLVDLYSLASGQPCFWRDSVRSCALIMEGSPENWRWADLIIYFYQCDSFSHSFSIFSSSWFIIFGFLTIRKFFLEPRWFSRYSDWLDYLRFGSWREWEILWSPKPTVPALLPIKPSIEAVLGQSRREREVNQPLLPNSEFRNEWSCTSTPHGCLIVAGRKNLHFCCWLSFSAVCFNCFILFSSFSSCLTLRRCVFLSKVLIHWLQWISWQNKKYVTLFAICCVAYIQINP